MIYHLPAPLLAHHGAIPPQSRPIPAEKTVFAENFGFFARFCRKIRTVRPKMRRNSKAKAATMPTHTQADSRTRNFPHLRVPPSRSQLQRKSNRSRAHLRAERQPYPQFPIPLCCHPAAHGAFPPQSRRKFRLSLRFSSFSRDFSEKIAPRTAPPTPKRSAKAKIAVVHICAQNNDGAHDFPSLRATTRPPQRISAPIPPDSRRKFRLSLKFSAFSRDFSEKYAPSAPKCDATQKQKQRPCSPTHRTTAIPTISRISAYRPAAPNCSAKATAAAHTCAQNRDHAHNFL